MKNTTIRIWDLDPDLVKRFKRIRKKYGREQNYLLHRLIEMYVIAAEMTDEDPLNLPGHRIFSFSKEDF